MKKLVIYLTTYARVRQCEAKTNVIEVTPGWLGTEPAERYAQAWARLWPDDIVMVMRTECHGDGEQHCCCDQLEDCEEVYQ